MSCDASRNALAERLDGLGFLFGGWGLLGGWGGWGLLGGWGFGARGRRLEARLALLEPDHGVEPFGLALVREDREQAASVRDLDQERQQLALLRFAEGREGAVDDYYVRPLHEAAHEVDARPLLRGQQPPGRSDLMRQPDPLDAGPQAELVDDGGDRLRDPRLRVGGAVIDPAEEEVVLAGRRGADLLGVVEFDAGIGFALEPLAHGAAGLDEASLDLLVEKAEAMARLDIGERQGQEPRQVVAP